jgi:uncharacterized protein
MKKFFLAIFCLAVLPWPVLAYYDLGKPQGFVNDYALMLSDSTRQQLELELVNFEKSTANEIAVATIDSLRGDTIENFAVKLFENWQIGKKDNDNGVLLLIAKEERKIRIEVGYGLEGALTDLESYSIINNIISPAFKNGDYDAGIWQGVSGIMDAIKGEIPASNTTSDTNQNFKFSLDLISFIFIFISPLFTWLASVLARSKSWWLGGAIGGLLGLGLIFIIGWHWGLIILVILTLLGLLFDYLVSKNYRTQKALGKKPSWWAGGGGFSSGGGFGGGGFGGFGGGSSGGGGASGGW